jgi:hypothetical protein
MAEFSMASQNSNMAFQNFNMAFQNFNIVEIATPWLA